MTTLKNIPTLIGGAAVIAAAALCPGAAIASAEWDIDRYDVCMSRTIRDTDGCCIVSGGDLGSDGVCRAPAANAAVQQEESASLPPQINVGTRPTMATDAPDSPAPGSNAPGGLTPGGTSR
ncbi:hypothetical protein [Mycolicibacterium pyrenivorans]|uniref:hypothetical protein n=1 Tax=Mycolicibacterium pyrenivorans TaxID=187102 RepID=UPI0021F2E417|nr:hypothetical protein [Mycolicibacterium pyrenivorans]MCV7154759.1 hypothetical protein [Mycolicibacterium pyrenivorans]